MSVPYQYSTVAQGLGLTPIERFMWSTPPQRNFLALPQRHLGPVVDKAFACHDAVIAQHHVHESDATQTASSDLRAMQHDIKSFQQHAEIAS